MKIYHESRGKHTLFVQPGTEIKNVSEWLDAEGNPILYTIHFENGEAKVKPNLGKYLIDRKLVKSSPLILLEELIA